MNNNKKNDDKEKILDAIRVILFIAVLIGAYCLIDYMNTPKGHQYNEWDRKYVEERSKAEAKKARENNSSRKYCFEVIGYETY